MREGWGRAGLMWVATVLVCPAVLSQETTLGQAELEQLFERSRQEPANLDVLFELARVAVDVGDYEAAIGALERMLIFNPDLPRVRLELGALYFRLKSYALARTYLEQVLESLEQEPDATVEGRVQEILLAIEQQTQRLRVWGGLSLALSHQSNPATLADQGTTVNLGVADLPVTTDTSPDGDQRLQFSGNLNGRYDWQNAWNDALEVELRVFAQEYRDQTALNLGVVDVSVGPALGLARHDLPGMLRPFVVGSHVHYNDERLFWEGGGGLQWRGVLAAGVLNTRASYEYRVRRHKDTPGATVTDRDGDWHRGTLQLQAGVRDWRLESGMALRSYSADTAHNSFKEWRLQLGAGRQLALGIPAQLRTTVGFTHAGYDSPDPTIQRDRTRNDNEVRVGTSLHLLFSRHWSGIGSVEYTRRSSNVPIYEYDGWGVTLGVSRQF